jgi:hypothetical protein
MRPDSPSNVHALALVDALEHVHADDLAELQRHALAGMQAWLGAGDVAFAAVWQAIGRCARAERGRREQEVIDFADELDGPQEGYLADGWSLPPGWVVEEHPDDVTGGEYDDR